MAQQFETAQFMPPAARKPLADGLVCYARSVVHKEWPEMRGGSLDSSINPWSVDLFKALQDVNPQTPKEQAAFCKVDRPAHRARAGPPGPHPRCAGRHPAVSVWVGLLLMAAVVFGFMMFFADPGERWYVQAVQIGTVAVVITTTLFIIRVLDNPFETGGGALRPIAMERTLDILDQTRKVVGMTGPLPCDKNGVRLAAS